MPNTVLFATSTFFDSQFALLLLTLLALAAFSLALLLSYGVITQRDAADAREIAALTEIIANLGEEPFARVDSQAGESASVAPPEAQQAGW